jgi:predicted XRE-type DNA-binding protein
MQKNITKKPTKRSSERKVAKRVPNRPVVTDSSGDVYADLDLKLSGHDAWKLAIAREITGVISRGKMTQAKVAQILGTDQAKVSNITRGRLKGFSLERLVLFLLTLGYDIDVHISQQPARANIRGQVRVHHAAMAM